MFKRKYIRLSQTHSNNSLWKWKECKDNKFASAQLGVAKNLCVKLKNFQEIPLHETKQEIISHFYIHLACSNEI